MTDKIHINELLTYVTHYINNSTVENIKRIIKFFYTDEEISDAKKFLWDVCKDNLPQAKERKSTKIRTKSAADIDDIFEAVQSLDADGNIPDL